MRAPVIFRKTLGDVSNPKILTAYLVPFLLVGGFLALGLSSDLPDGFAALPLGRQEAELTGTFAAVSFFWGAGIPVLALGGILSANTLAKEAEKGTLRILLSKPIRRWEVVVGMFGAVLVYSFLVAAAGMLLLAVAFRVTMDADPTALDGVVLRTMPGNLAFALFVSVVAAATGTALAVFTRSRLRTALLVLLLPLFYFAFLPIRALAGESYEDYHLYLADVNYHFGNVFVVVHDAAGTGFTPETQASLAAWTGVYDAQSAAYDPMLGGLPTTLELAGHVPAVASLAGLLVGSLGLFVAAVYRFERVDVP